MPIYLASRKNVSKKVLKAASLATLALTDRARIFVGSTRTVRVKAVDIVVEKPAIDGVVVNSGVRADPLVLLCRPSAPFYRGNVLRRIRASYFYSSRIRHFFVGF